MDANRPIEERTIQVLACQNHDFILQIDSLSTQIDEELFGPSPQKPDNANANCLQQALSNDQDLLVNIANRLRAVRNRLRESIEKTQTPMTPRAQGRGLVAPHSEY